MDSDKEWSPGEEDMDVDEDDLSVDEEEEQLVILCLAFNPHQP